VDTTPLFNVCTFLGGFLAFLASMLHLLLNTIYPPFDLVPAAITTDNIATFCTGVASATTGTGM